MTDRLEGFNDAKYLAAIHMSHPGRRWWQFWKRNRPLIPGKEYHIDKANGVVRFRRGHMRQGVKYTFEYTRPQAV